MKYDVSFIHPLFPRSTYAKEDTTERALLLNSFAKLVLFSGILMFRENLKL